MSDQEKKLKEAEYFFNGMVNNFQNELFEQFNYDLSAFLTAARSILQYSYEYAKNNGKLGEYNRLISNNSVLRFFKEQRDINIHTIPVETIQQVNLDIYTTIRIRSAVTIKVMDNSGNVTEERTYGSLDDSDNQSVSKAPLSPTRSLQYKFSDWTGEEDVIELATKYLDELQLFISNAKDVGVIN